MDLEKDRPIFLNPGDESTNGPRNRFQSNTSLLDDILVTVYPASSPLIYYVFYRIQLWFLCGKSIKLDDCPMIQS